jgi:branched-chain amino acid transport system permease protein
VNLESLAFHALNGLASASSLFMVAAGLSLIFGVSRIVNFAHGSLYMVGLYLACGLVMQMAPSQGPLPAWVFWVAVLLAALLTAVLGMLIEIGILRRIYAAPELFQLLATFAIALILRDAVLWIWGPEDLLGPKAPGLKGAITVFGARLPMWDALMIFVGPLVLGLMLLLMNRSRFGMLVRAATQDREMVAALGIDERRLFTAVFALGALLAGLGGALQMPREPAHLSLDLAIVGEAFVVVVVGGMGSLPGAFLAALLIAQVKALCTALGTVSFLGLEIALPRLTLVAEFLVMGAVLALRPWGLLGKPLSAVRAGSAAHEAPLHPAGRPARVGWIALLLMLLLVVPGEQVWPYLPVIGIDILVAVLFAVSLHLILGPAGLHSFGHAAWFGLGAYGAALAFKLLHWPMLWALLGGTTIAACGAALFGAFAIRLSGVYFAMLTLAFAQLVWAGVFQWDAVTGGSNGLIGLWPPPWASVRGHYFLMTLALVAFGVFGVRLLLHSPLGWSIRAVRDSAQRSEASGIAAGRVQWLAFMASAMLAGLAGALYTFAKGTISPEALGVGRSVDGLVMVLLGGMQALAGPVVGAVAYTGLQDVLMRGSDYWRATLGAVILFLVIVFPQGMAGGVQALALQWRARRSQHARRVQRPQASPESGR